MGLHPFHLPLAINFNNTERNQCTLCTTCDTFACAIGAKNDLDTMLLRKMSRGQLDLHANCIATKFEEIDGSIRKVHCIDRSNEKKFTLTARIFVSSAGALASPHLILNSGLEKLNPAGHIVGRYLMRHVNAIVFGIFPKVADPQYRFHKELAIMDYYFGSANIQFPRNKIGSLQQVPTPPGGLVRHEAPKPLGKLAAVGVKLLSGLLAIAEDQPQYGNFIGLDPVKNGKYEMSVPIVSHEYSKRDLASLDVLIQAAKQIMKKSGAMLNYVHHIRTFSHSAGTIRMGDDPETAPLDKYCSFRGIENLYVVDACFMPTSAAVNPSLTISANALRVGDHLIKQYSL